MTLRLDRGIADRHLQLRSYRQHELVLQRIIERVLPKEREVPKALHPAIVEWRNMAPVVAASYAESRHKIVIHIENFLDRESDAVSICIAASDPRRGEDVELIRRRGILSNQGLQKNIISDYPVCESSGRYRDGHYQRESAYSSHVPLRAVRTSATARDHRAPPPCAGLHPQTSMHSP